ncbi:MAG: hypothetical protein ACO3FE_03590 [Planctomycetaceae bacterium]
MVTGCTTNVMPLRCTVGPHIGVLKFCWLLAGLLLLPGETEADQHEDLMTRAGIQIVNKGVSSGDVRKQAAASIPWQRMSSANRARAAEIVNSCTQFRRLPQLDYAIDHEIYSYLLKHPDVAVSTWRVMGISEFQMLQTGPQLYSASASDGSEGIAEILYQDDQEIVFVCSGEYRNVLLPRPLTASALIRFRTVFTQHQRGTHLVRQTGDVFVHFPSVGVAGLAKLLSPVTNSLMDRNLFEVSLYAAMMSRAVQQDPHWVIGMAHDLDGVHPDRRRELAAVARAYRLSDPEMILLRPVSSANVSSRPLIFRQPAVDPQQPAEDSRDQFEAASAGGAAGPADASSSVEADYGSGSRFE